MHALYLPYESEFDEGTRTHCLSGEDSSGDLFGVGAGATVELSERRLREYVLEVLDFHASQGEDLFGDLRAERPGGPHVEFDPVELFPIRLKLARVRAGLRQADAAARLGVSQQGYARLEKAGANPTLRTVLQAEKVLGCELLIVAAGQPRRRKKTDRADAGR